MIRDAKSVKISSNALFSQVVRFKANLSQQLCALYLALPNVLQKYSLKKSLIAPILHCHNSWIEISALSGANNILRWM